MNSAFMKLIEWAKSGTPEQRRFWSVSTLGYADNTVRISLSWCFGDSQLGGIDKLLTQVEMKLYPITSISFKIDEALKEFQQCMGKK